MDSLLICICLLSADPVTHLYFVRKTFAKLCSKGFPPHIASVYCLPTLLHVSCKTFPKCSDSNMSKGFPSSLVSVYCLTTSRMPLLQTLCLQKTFAKHLKNICKRLNLSRKASLVPVGNERKKLMNFHLRLFSHSSCLDR